MNYTYLYSTGIVVVVLVLLLLLFLNEGMYHKSKSKTVVHELHVLVQYRRTSCAFAFAKGKQNYTILLYYGSICEHVNLSATQMTCALSHESLVSCWSVHLKKPCCQWWIHAVSLFPAFSL
jgi:hypothetical protein